MSEQTEPIEQEIDWAAGQELTGCSDMQTAFVRGLCQGLSKTRAAMAAGYRGEGSGLRGLASRMAKSHKVRALLAWAKAGGAGPSEVPGDMIELKKILWRHARAADPMRSIKATEAIARFEEREREANKVESYDPIATLDLLAVHAPLIAAMMAVQHGLPWPPKVTRHTAMMELDGFLRMIEAHTAPDKAEGTGAAADVPPADPHEARANGATRSVA